MIGSSETNWQISNSHSFWDEIDSDDHLVQFYNNDEILLDSLENFATTGFENDECVLVIATKAHLKSLKRRIVTHGYDIEKICLEGKFIPLDANDMLSKFMVTGWPDKALFMNFVTKIITKAHGTAGRKVRAFGEMVSILWAQGYTGATIQLQDLWNQVRAIDSFCLFCAYPKSIFLDDTDDSIEHICLAHNKIVAGDVQSKTEVVYKAA